MGVAVQVAAISIGLALKYRFFRPKSSTHYFPPAIRAFSHTRVNEPKAKKDIG
jgi:hypothetical protein